MDWLVVVAAFPFVATFVVTVLFLRRAYRVNRRINTALRQYRGLRHD